VAGSATRFDFDLPESASILWNRHLGNAKFYDLHCVETLRTLAQKLSSASCIPRHKNTNPSFPENEKLLQEFTDDYDDISSSPESMALGDEGETFDSRYVFWVSKPEREILPGRIRLVTSITVPPVVIGDQSGVAFAFCTEIRDSRLAWRLELSKKLHRKFEKGRRTAPRSFPRCTPRVPLMC